MNIWSRLGLTVAIAAVFCIVLTEGIQERTQYQTFRWYAFGVLAVAGAAMIIVTFTLYRRQKRLIAISRDAENSSSSLSTLMSQFRFWGPTLVAFATIILFLPYKEKEVAAAEPVPRPRATSSVPVTVSIPPPSENAKPLPTPPTNAPSFPELKINGFIYRPPSNAIVVGGKSYFVGDGIGSARVFSISADAVVLEQGGYFKVFPIDPMAHSATKGIVRSK
jgi:hypothetical protein